jgi:hypothetical protein
VLTNILKEPLEKDSHIRKQDIIGPNKKTGVPLSFPQILTKLNLINAKSPDLKSGLFGFKGSWFYRHKKNAPVKRRVNFISVI